jgi:hypothetical protein
VFIFDAHEPTGPGSDCSSDTSLLGDSRQTSSLLSALNRNRAFEGDKEMLNVVDAYCVVKTSLNAWT